MSELWRLFSLLVEENEESAPQKHDYPSEVYVDAAVYYMMTHYNEKMKILNG
ncbi:MAG: hypothetical protein ACERKZ_13485 [Lachnotalea sp.]